MAFSLKMVAPTGLGGTVQGRSGFNYTIDSNGTITVLDPGDVLPLAQNGWGLLGGISEKASFNSPLPADLVSVKAAATPANGAITIAAQPAHARKLQVRTVLGTPGTTNITAGTLALVGTDQDGNAISEVINLAAGAALSLTQTTKWAYATLTSGTVANYAASGSGTGNTLGIGVSNDFGVPTAPGGGFNTTSLVCVKATKVIKVLGTSNIATDDIASTAVVDAVARTINPTTAPAANGLNDYEFSYVYNAPT